MIKQLGNFWGGNDFETGPSGEPEVFEPYLASRNVTMDAVRFGDNLMTALIDRVEATLPKTPELPAEQPRQIAEVVELEAPATTAVTDLEAKPQRVASANAAVEEAYRSATQNPLFGQGHDSTTKAA